MKFFKPILFVLTLLVVGLIIFQFGTVRLHQTVPEEVPKFNPATDSANILLTGSISSNAVSDAEGSSAGTGTLAVIPLIRGGEKTDIQWTSRTPAARRVRKISPDPVWMTSPPVLKAGDLITLALFKDAIFKAEISNVTRYPNGGVGMTAHLRDGQNGTVYLSYYKGRLTASVETSGGADFSIEYRNGDHYAVEMDQANCNVLTEASPEIPPVHDAVADSSDGSASPFSTVSGTPAGSAVIDVMFVYTPAARSWAETNNGIVNIINSAMQRANETHTNSATQAYLHLVHSEEVNYTEQGIYADLDNLTYTGGGHAALDEVQSLRDQYSADLVCLLELTQDAGGLGWQLNTTNGTPAYGFCVTRVQQSSWTYTIVHEWGHNMGCHHSKTQVLEKGPGLYSYSAGWQWNDTLAQSTYPYTRIGYCTVMTYEDFDHDGTNEYITVPYFSNPDIVYIGNSTNAVGDAADGDNARTIRETRAVIAAYRKAPDLDYDGLPNEWEQQYFGGETNADPSALASNGVNTVMDAYIAGISPVNPNDFFKTTVAAASNGFVVGWNATSGRVYSVNWTAALTNNFQALETNIVWPQSSYTDTVHDAESRSFYQINVHLSP